MAFIKSNFKALITALVMPHPRHEIPDKNFIGHPIEGWTTTVMFLSVAFLGLFGILTIIVKYLQIIVDMVFKRKHYNYESIEKLTK